MADPMNTQKPYEKPKIVDYGPITAHTFTRAGGNCQSPNLGPIFNQYSCTSFSS